MRLITLDDFIDTYFKIVQRGSTFILSKFTFNQEKRTKSAFDNTSFISSYFWNIPKVQKRWNTLISGDENKNYIDYILEDLLKDKKGLKLLSIGSGISNREIELAENRTIFKEVVCVDIADNLLNFAKEDAAKKGLTNIKFIAQNIYEFDFKESEYDIVFFKSSLHHFNEIDKFLTTKIRTTLKKEGLLIINEFVGATRHQFSKKQISEINKAIKMIPKKYRIRFKSKFHKNKYRGVGTLRMIIADPSECVDSSSIMPSIHKNFSTITEKPYGGNLLLSALRDISHHFYELNDEKEKVLNELFQLEDNFLKNHASDYVFGVYKNKK
ncbi:methyltransferase domain-containing protein [Polaribacter sp. P097]|uniref:methyltransferase domain-containing protein n=1 Tax=Polaribacter sp. P097 TaxID=3117398 RepID=UPI002FE05E2A